MGKWPRHPHRGTVRLFWRDSCQDARASMGYQPIADYGVIGDLHTAALVGRNGSIDWLCLPRFDSPSIFAAILDEKIGGRFQITVVDPTGNRQLYVPDTNVLLTRFYTSAGVGEVYDRMPVESDEAGQAAPIHDLVRVVHAVRGPVAFELTCRPAFDFARADHVVEAVHDGFLFISRADCRQRVSLLATVPLEIRDGTATARFDLKADEWAAFVLQYVDDAHPATRIQPIGAIRTIVQKTVDYWQRWLGGSTYHGRWREVVHRSALTLKLLTYAPTGALVAAPTTSLPEGIGGVRNWDYRYTWIRDASFMVFALMRIGFVEEAARFIDWLTQRVLEANGDSPLQMMYRIDGSRLTSEEELLHLDGYRGSRPVRIGNGAHDQLQLDIYGALLDSIYLYDKYGRPISYDLWKHLVRLLGWLAENWEQPDDGIWEVRGGRRTFVFSRMMCWVAFDRAPDGDQARPTGPALGLGRDRLPHLRRRHASRLESAARQLRPVLRLRLRRRGELADAARQVRLPDRSTDARHDRARAPGPGQRQPGLPLPPGRVGPRRFRGRRGHILAVLVLVGRGAYPRRPPARGPADVRQDAHLREPPRPLRRAARPLRRGPRQLPAGFHPPGAGQRGVQPRSRAG